jgi:hypothetical protein
MSVRRKLPYQPQMGELLETTECLNVSEFILKDDPADKMLSETALARNAELLRKLCPDMRDWSYFHIKVSSAFKFMNLMEIFP